MMQEFLEYLGTTFFRFLSGLHLIFSPSHRSGRCSSPLLHPPQVWRMSSASGGGRLHSASQVSSCCHSILVTSIKDVQLGLLTLFPQVFIYTQTSTFADDPISPLAMPIADNDQSPPQPRADLGLPVWVLIFDVIVWEVTTVLRLLWLNQFLSCITCT